MLRVRFAQFLLIFSISCSLLSTLGLATEALEETRFKRLNSALELLNITPEPSYARELEPLNNAQRASDFETFLAFFDHKSEFLR